MSLPGLAGNVWAFVVHLFVCCGPLYLFSPAALISLYYFSDYNFEIDNCQNPQTLLKSGVSR